jgi:uncharacterized membrane protein
MLIVLGPVAYAFLPGPQLQMGNQSRYVSSVILPMALLFARLSSKITLQIRRRELFFLFALLLFYSYHHRYTFIQSSQFHFLTIQLLALLGLFVWFDRNKKIQIPHAN